MKRYLLDTNTCIYYLKGMFNLDEKLRDIDRANCFISEITLAELKFGVEKSERKEQNRKALDDFVEGITVLPIFHSLDIYAREKARLQQAGIPLDDFDLLIGVTAIVHDLVMVTNDRKHFQRLQEIEIEDWTSSG